MRFKLYHQASYLPQVPLDKRNPLVFVRLFLAIILVVMIALLGSCSKKTMLEPSRPLLDLSKAAIKKFSLPGSIQVGETVFGIDEDGYNLTINIKSGADLTSMRPYIELLAGSYISPSIGQIVNLNGDLVYKVTTPDGEVQNWRVHIVRQEPAYLTKIFKENDKVIFVGNSITHGGRYHSYIWLYYMTRFPNRRITIMNGGIGGDKISNINNRLEEDVYSKNPSRINLTFGMNDSGYFDYLFKDPVVVSNKLVFSADSAFKLVTASLNAHPQIKVTMMAGSPYDATTTVTSGGWSEKPATFDRIVNIQRDAAVAHHWAYIDIYHNMDNLNKFYQKADPKFTLSGSGDRIHPESYGHLVMAYLYLRQQDLKGLEVADFTVDATMKRVTAASHCEVRDVIGNGDNLTFHYRADALPFPVDDVKHAGDGKPASAALDYIPFTDDLNREMLRVTNLKGNHYDVKIDGKVIGRFSSADLATGVNMALIRTTPQYLQALEIMKKNESRFSEEKRLRDYYVVVFNYARPAGITNDNDPASVAKIQELAKTNGWIDANLYKQGSNPATRQQWQANADKYVNEIYASNKPLTRTIELIKAD
ncbi:hypothetical protein EOD41_06670 [Mucilaginibacter limnophilus]|uniref:SGNH hydrolase-type esterase domain-containing protein n=1 Tax=Mucilaginibacter limnophilus TaxID=1932778 RepID=A0A437MVE8_9SPHI|nr:SGNH/GDSL hydrolase family protein [Mucilaginibacter limnophilus]RVU01639.1 hypothetical protein EOD41_06670 [Mucilaginibacter limnophilus]